MFKIYKKDNKKAKKNNSNNKLLPKKGFFINLRPLPPYMILLIMSHDRSYKDESSYQFLSETTNALIIYAI